MSQILPGNSDYDTKHEAIQLHMAGYGYAAIANHQSRSLDDVKSDIRSLILEGKTDEDIEFLRAKAEAQLDAMLASRWPDMKAGDDDAFDRVLEVIKTKNRLLGLNAPKRTEITGAGGGAINIGLIEAAQNVLDVISEEVIEAVVLGELDEGESMD